MTYNRYTESWLIDSALQNEQKKITNDLLSQSMQAGINYIEKLKAFESPANIKIRLAQLAAARDAIDTREVSARFLEQHVDELREIINKYSAVPAKRKPIAEQKTAVQRSEPVLPTAEQKAIEAKAAQLEAEKEAKRRAPFREEDRGARAIQLRKVSELINLLYNLEKAVKGSATHRPQYHLHHKNLFVVDEFVKKLEEKKAELEAVAAASPASGINAEANATSRKLRF